MAPAYRAARRGRDPASDIDLYVLHDAPHRRRIQRFFEGVPTEIFINPPHAVRSYFAREQKDGRRVTPHMLATGVVILDRDPVVKQPRAESREWLGRAEVFSAGDAQRLDLAFQVADHTIQVRRFFEWDSGRDPMHAVGVQAVSMRQG